MIGLLTAAAKLAWKAVPLLKGPAEGVVEHAVGTDTGKSILDHAVSAVGTIEKINEKIHLTSEQKEMLAAHIFRYNS